MTDEILVNFTPIETRVVIIENGMPQELYIERSNKRGIVGNVYLGTVLRLLPGMQAAFVDIGLEKAAFLPFSELSKDYAPAQESNTRNVAAVNLTEKQTVVVQVTKDPMGTKGARLTTHVSLPSRYLVFIPNADHIGISQRIEEEAERERLKAILEACLDKNGESSESHGYILRTMAEGADEKALRSDINFLHRLWEAIQSMRAKCTPPVPIYEDLPLHMRVLRDMAQADTERIRIDSKETYTRACAFSRSLIPEVLDKLEYYAGERPIFDLYNVEEEIQRSLGRKILLKSGGYLVFDQTEAMTTIDVNTGAYVGHRNLEETIFKTNLEAATAIARQLRLRNLGGIIIIDFIDMTDSEHQRQVHRTLERVLENDNAKCNITGVSELGLIEMTRKRNRESLEHVLCETCVVCNGRGSVKTAETISYEIFREVLRQHRAYEASSYLVIAAPSVVDYLVDEASEHVADLEAFIAKTVRFQAEAFYSQEQFDVIMR